MLSPVHDLTQATSVVMPHQQPELPPVNEAAAVAKATSARPLSLPDDVVTFSSLSEDSSPKKKASQPVSNEERRALLDPSSLRKNFSVFG